MVALLLVASITGAAAADTRQVDAGVQALGRMRQGSLVGELQLRHLTSRRELGQNRGLDRVLLTAIRLAVTNPKAALQLLSHTEEKAASAGTILPAKTLGAIRAAATQFDHERPLTLSPEDPSVRALTRRPRGLSLPELHQYARDYAAHMRRYNGNRPEEVLESYTWMDLKSMVRGQVSYWDVDARHAEVVGLAEQSPFRTASGQVRVYNHYADTAREAALTDAFGAPTGKIAAEMSSSYRTLVLFPERGVPFMLKFSGEWFSGDKQLQPHQVRISVERTLHLRDDPALVPEPAGLIVRQPAVTVLYRPLPVPRNGQLARGDSLLSAHVLNDPRFAETELGKRIFARHGSTQAWFEKELAPKLAEVVYRSMTSSFTHLELHSQNIDALVAADGAVREVFVKDLLDMMHDPALQSAMGQRPRANAVLRDVEWKNIGEPGAKYGVRGFYGAFLGQTTYPGDAPQALSPFHEALREEIVALAAARLPLARLRPYREFARVGEKIGVHETLGLLRELLVKSNLQANFRKDDRARRHLDHGPGLPLRSPTRRDPNPDTWHYGYVGDVPVAVKHRANGLIEDYFFRFE